MGALRSVWSGSRRRSLDYRMFEKRRFILATGIGSRRNRSIIKLLVSTPEAWRKSAPGERNVASHRGLVKLEKHTPKACEEKLPRPD